ncbi:GroES-like zinc-binding dehydrogenase family protein isoform 5, partial [Theobroma cacao]
AGKAIRCKAAVSRNPGEALVIEEIEVEPPKSWEVRVKILCTSLCHSDITFWKMSTGPFAIFPRIFGHEAVGVVESVGEHVKEVQEGDLVLPVFHPHCRECRDCKSQKGNGCSVFGYRLNPDMPRDATSRFKGMNGEVLHHFLFVSSFTEYTVVDVAHVVKISSEIPVDKACLLSCGVSTGIKEMTDGGADYCFECIGLASLMEDAFNSNREGWGKTVILGVEKHGTPLALNTYLLLRGRSVTGCLFGGFKPKSDIPLLAEKYLDKELNLDGFITHELSFQDINKAFELLLQGKSLRCIIWMDN